MSLSERIERDLKEAMRAREAGKARLSVLRLIRAAAKNQEIEKGRPLDEGELLQVVAKEVRAREEVLPEYERSGRDDLIARLKEEIAILREYLPPPLTHAEVVAAVEKAIAQVGATSRRDMGKVMGILMRELRGRVDGDELRRVVEERLS